MSQNIFTDRNECVASYGEVSKLILYADPKATREDINLHFFNYCEVKRDGGDLVDFLNQAGVAQAEWASEDPF